MVAYYNEHDPKAAAWLRELIKAGHIAPGEVDERSIEDVVPNELAGFTQCHFFAGIGVWSYALRLAGWSDDRPVWTGSCPCQPFSSSGKREGTSDERHLWPALHFLIEQRRPAVFLGEQVASKDGLAWLDIVHSDLAAAGYAIGAADLCAAGVGAPHIRQRLWIIGKRLGNTDSNGPKEQFGEPGEREQACRSRSAEAGFLGRLGDTSGQGSSICQRQDVSGARRREEGRAAEQPGHSYGPVADDNKGRREEFGSSRVHADGERGNNAAGRGENGGAGPTNGFWRAADWLHCRDGKWRPVEPGTFPLAHGAPSRVGRLRGYGNAIPAQAAQAFIESVMEIIDAKAI